jgi:cytochrome c peroxidase
MAQGKNFNRLYIVSVIFLICVAGAMLWLDDRANHALDVTTAPQTVAEFSSQPIQPIPLALELDQRKVDLGRNLFHDTRLSADNTISCASCHQIASGGANNQPVSMTFNESFAALNVPTIFNSEFNFREFWDGRADSEQAQFNDPNHNMGTNWSAIIALLEADYAPAFDTVYHSEITPEDIQDAITTYAESLFTPNSRFDQYLRGDESAITAEELEGYQLFVTYGCITCHQGINVGGNMYQRFGIVADYFADRGVITEADYGRFNLTGDEDDRYVFKVPGLRNVALTAPYLHDGSVDNLEEVVSVMGYYQLGRNLSGDDINSIVGFLKTLTGEHAELEQAG